MSHGIIVVNERLIRARIYPLDIKPFFFFSFSFFFSFIMASPIDILQKQITQELGNSVTIVGKNFF